MNDLFPCTCPTCGQDIAPQSNTPFDKFWRDWPSKVGKAPARKAWYKMDKQDRHDATTAAGAWFTWWRKENPQASPIHAATYLNNRRWEDEYGGGPVDETSILAYYADLINGDKFIAQNAVTLDMQRRLVAAGLVTQARMSGRVG